MSCPFCDITTQKKEQYIRENAHTLVILSNPRLMPGHLLVIPKRHVQKLSELSKEESDELFSETVRLQEKVLEFSPGCDISQHFRPFVPDSRFKVSHLHMHVRPRSLDDELYQKVQIHERDVFQEPSQEEFEKYKAIFS